MVHPLLDLNQFAKDYPPRDDGDGCWREKESHELFLQPGVRVRLHIDHTPDIGYGLWRDDKLGEAGIHAADEDSKAFAERLEATLGDHFSIRNLQHLVQVFTDALQTAEASRQASIARMNRADRNT